MDQLWEMAYATPYKNALIEEEMLMDLVPMDLVFAAYVWIIKKVPITKCDLLNFPLLLIVALTCGGTSRENCTYLTQPATIPTSCVYNICPVENNICRIRYDFTVRIKSTHQFYSLKDF